MEIKVCGMRDLGNIRNLIQDVRPDWMGLIFYPKSPRFVSNEKTEEIASIPAKKVGVFVNESVDEILKKVKEFGLSAIQLHGSESPEFVEDLSQKTDKEIWKVVSVGEQIKWEEMEGYLPWIQLFLFDTASSSHGGTGKKFNWEILKSYPFEKGFFLSGGIDEESAEKVLKLSKEIPQLKGVDLNSRFELQPGIKNIEKLKSFRLKIVN